MSTLVALTVSSSPATPHVHDAHDRIAATARLPAVLHVEKRDTRLRQWLVGCIVHLYYIHSLDSLSTTHLRNLKACSNTAQRSRPRCYCSPARTRSLPNSTHGARQQHDEPDAARGGRAQHGRHVLTSSRWHIRSQPKRCQARRHGCGKKGGRRRSLDVTLTARRQHDRCRTRCMTKRRT